jgi:hypothetical protein
MDTTETKMDVKLDLGWAQNEFGKISFGDTRLDKRFRKVAEDLSQLPERSINQASKDHAATKAAYRLFQNEKCSTEKIFSAHREQTLSRLRGEKLVLGNQDTSFFNYTGHKKTKNLGPIGDKKSNPQGLMLHSTFVVTPAGLPLGSLTFDCGARDAHLETAPKGKRELEDKESYRWIEALRNVAGIPNLVMQGDRENDIYEYLAEAERLNIQYNIRSCNDRVITSPEYTLLQTFLGQCPSEGTIEIVLPRDPSSITMEVRYSPIEIRPPARITKSKKAKGIECWVVQIKQINTPKGVPPISWTLLTNVPVETFADALERVDWYKRRWSIEEYHKIIKSGCNVEKCRLDTAEKLIRYIALSAVISWRIFWMVHISRVNPNAPAEEVLTQVEIQTLRTLKRFDLFFMINQNMTVRKAIIAISCLGGYLNRKNDPPPRVIVLWRGWQCLNNMTEVYESMSARCG